MGSTGEPDRKRRHLSSVSPTAATAMAKKLPFSHPSEEKKLDKAVLQYQNQKLLQKLEVQKVEYKALENKFSQLKEKQQPHDTILRTVKKSFEKLVSDLQTSSNGMRELSCCQDSRNISIPKDDCSSSHEDAFLSRLVETGATRNSALNNCLVEIKHGEIPTEQIENILCNIVAAISDLWHLKDGLHAAILKELSEDGECRQKTSAELGAEVKNLRLGFSNLHLKQKSMGRELLKCQDIDAKNKAYIKQLKGELENSVAELADSSGELATLKAERDATKGAFFPIFNVGSKHSTGDKVKDKQKDKHEMESTLRELSDQASSQLVEIGHLHDERIKMLQQSSDLQNSLKNVKCLTSSQGCLLLRDRLEKSKTEVSQYQALFKKLQVEKDSLVWKEKELNMKTDLGEVFRRCSAVSDLRIDDLVKEIQKQVSERNIIQNKLDKASRKPGRKDIIAKFKALVSSFPEEMGSMQGQLRNFKQAASDINHLQADAQSLSRVLDMKAKENESLSARAANQVSEMCNLQSVLQDLKAGDVELKLILEMYMSESIDSSDVLQAKNMEYNAWAQVRSLESSLDERNLELRVKTANEAEAISQQRLAAAEAEIAELRQKLESSKRDLLCFSDILKSKNEENEAYLSEIETIGQAYDDMQTQNQHLLQQITERDDYNIKLVVEGLKARQLQDSLFLEKKTIEREIEQARVSLDFYDVKAARIEDQLKICSDQLHKLGEDKFHYSVMLENTQKKSQDARRLLDQTKDAIEISQFRVDKGRAAFLDLQIQLETERFSKRRMEEDLEVLRRKVSYLRAQMDGSSVAEKLQQELREYREIVKCSICIERPKEVVITKCYHLFCNPCVQRIIESRHRKCPACSTTFGPNDVKPVYI